MILFNYIILSMVWCVFRLKYFALSRWLQRPFKCGYLQQQQSITKCLLSLNELTNKLLPYKETRI